MSFKDWLEAKEYPWQLWDGGSEPLDKDQIERLFKWRQKSHPNYEFRIIPSIWGEEGCFAIEGKKKGMKKEAAGDSGIQFSSKDDYDQCLHRQTPLGNLKPLIPNAASREGKKIEKLFKGKRVK